MPKRDRQGSSSWVHTHEHQDAPCLGGFTQQSCRKLDASRAPARGTTPKGPTPLHPYRTLPFMEKHAPTAPPPRW